MEKVKNFQELVSLSEDELSSILGNDANGRLLWNGLHNSNLDRPVINTNTATVARGGKRGSKRGRKGKK